MLKCSTSLWSADLSNLAAEMKRVEPYSERFHLDVCDGHYVRNMLFFPDLVRALRPHSGLPFEVHLQTKDPLGWVDPFVEAGADIVIFALDSAKDPGEVIRRIKSKGQRAGLSLLISEDADLVEPYWRDLDVLTILGTAMGIKGAEMDPCVPAKIRKARDRIRRLGVKTEIQADGGIRRHTVPEIADAGADWIVPGSLMFKEDPPEMRRWLANLEHKTLYL